MENEYFLYITIIDRRKAKPMNMKSRIIRLFSVLYTELVKLSRIRGVKGGISTKGAETYRGNTKNLIIIHSKAKKH